MNRPNKKDGSSEFKLPDTLESLLGKAEVML
jgi:hypothetical protein